MKRFRARIMNINKYDFTKSLSWFVCHIHLGQGHECFLSIPTESYNSITVSVITVWSGQCVCVRVCVCVCRCVCLCETTGITCKFPHLGPGCGQSTAGLNTLRAVSCTLPLALSHRDNKWNLITHRHNWINHLYYSCYFKLIKYTSGNF